MQSVINNKVIFTLVVLAIMALTSCGGGASLGLDSTSLVPGGSLGSSSNSSGTLVDDKGGNTGISDDGANHDINDDKGKHLPGLPADDKGGERSASAVETFPGSSAVEFAGGTIVDSTMVLSSTETEMAWALYKVEGLAGRKVTSLNIEALAPLGSSYSVGVSNYSEGVWDFLQSSGLPEFEIDFTDAQSRLTSEVGNLYFVVVVSGGTGATVTSASVISRELAPGEEELPCFGKGISASEGLADHILVSWAPIAGAGSYELWREADIEGQDEVAELIATIPAVEGQTEYSYEDFAIELSTEYKYRVRGVNSEGAGEFTRWRSGWAGATAPVGDDGIEDETGDDNGNDGTEIGDDNGNDGTETGDDNGNDGTEAGDDNGNDGTEDETGDDNGNDGTEDETGDDNGNDGTEDETGDDNGNDGTEDETGDDTII